MGTLSVHKYVLPADLVTRGAGDRSSFEGRALKVQSNCRKYSPPIILPMVCAVCLSVADRSSAERDQKQGMSMWQIIILGGK